MNHRTKYIALLAWAIMLIASCHHHPEGGHGHDHSGHEEDPLPTQSYLVRSDKHELFVEFDPLQVGVSQSFVAHFTNMTNAKPVISGQVELLLVDGSSVLESDVVDQPSVPGIFIPSLTPRSAISVNLLFILRSADRLDTLILEDVQIYADQEAAKLAPHTVPDTDISFTKEQSWRTDFAIEEVVPRVIHDVITTSGSITSNPSRSYTVSAQHAGVVDYAHEGIMVGMKVSKGSTICQVQASTIVDDNLTQRYRVAQSRLRKTEANLNRAEALLQDSIIGRKAYEERKMEYEIALADWQSLSSVDESGQLIIQAPSSGIISELHVANGAYAPAGQPIATILDNSKLRLRADLPQDRADVLHSIRSAKFKTASMAEEASIDSFAGQRLLTNTILTSSSPYITVEYSLENDGSLIAGAYADVRLLTDTLSGQVAIPKASVLRDFDTYYVYVQVGGECFERREVKIGVDDGERLQVISGLHMGDWVVTRGAYQLKMASMSSAIPAHGHAH